MTEAVVATGPTRVSLVAAQVAAYGCSVLIAAAACGLGAVLATQLGGESLPWQSVVEAALVLAAFSLCCYSLTFFIAQLTPSRKAAAAAGSALVTLLLLNSLSRTFQSLTLLRWLSPFHYYELSRPLVPGGPFDVRAVMVLIAAAIVLAAAAALAFARRDLGSPLLAMRARPGTVGREVSTNTWWRLPVLRELYANRVTLVAWTVGLAALAAILVWMTKTAIEPLYAIPEIGRVFAGFVTGEVFISFLDSYWLGTAQLLLVAFVTATVAGWAADDCSGRLEAVLSQPRSRGRVVVERAAALGASAAVFAAVTALVVDYVAHLAGIELDRGRIAAASFLLVPFSLVFGAAGLLLVSLQPRAATGLLGAFALASYLVAVTGPVLGWPDWAQDLSPFRLFGSPLLLGVDRFGVTLMLLFALAGLGGSILAFQRRDLGR